MIQTKDYDLQTIRKAYDRRRWVYSKTIAKVEFPYHEKAIEQAAIQPGERVLEVAVGPGLVLLELARRVGQGTPIHGVDLSDGMLDMTRRRLDAHGITHAYLQQADARRLPFEDNQFDVVYNGYMLDLIPEADMHRILTEFLRVLRPGGRLVLLNMSKKNAQRTDWRERFYKALPARFVLYVMGGCRPVLMQRHTEQVGFVAVTRAYMPGRTPSELVIAKKPNRTRTGELR